MLKPRAHGPINTSKMIVSDVHQLQADVDANPHDPFLRSNLACVLASNGDFESAMCHLGLAMDCADGAVAAGCVASAVRQVTDEFARLWQLPQLAPQLALISA